MTDSATPPFQKTAAARDVLRVLRASPNAWTWPNAVAVEARLARATVSSVLGRLERAGWVQSRRETQREAYLDFPARPVPRLYYQLTDTGRAGLAGLGEWLGP